MSDGYLVALLFNENGARKTSVSSGDSFGAEDGICRADSAASADLADIDVSAPNGFGQESEVCAWGLPHKLSEPAQRLYRDLSHQRVTSTFNLLAFQKESSDGAISTRPDTLLSGIPSSAPSCITSVRENQSSLERNCQTPSGSPASLDANSQISERLQSCLLTDDIPLEGFHTPMLREGEANFSRLTRHELLSPQQLCRSCQQRQVAQQSLQSPHNGSISNALEVSSKSSTSLPPVGRHSCVQKVCPSHGFLYQYEPADTASSLSRTKETSCRTVSAEPNQLDRGTAAFSGKGDPGCAESRQSSPTSDSSCHLPIDVATSYRQKSDRAHTLEVISDLNHASARMSDTASLLHPFSASSASTLTKDSFSLSFTNSVLDRGSFELHQQVLDPSQNLRLSSGTNRKLSPGVHLSGRTHIKTLIPGKYAPRHLAAAAVAVPARIARKFRANQHPAPIEEEPEKISPKSNRRASVRVDTSKRDPQMSLNGRDCEEIPVTQQKHRADPKRQQLTIAQRLPSIEDGGHYRRPTAFVTIPCIQGALSVRHGSSATSAAARAAATAAASGATKMRTSNNTKTLLSDVPSTASAASCPVVANCWRSTIGWGSQHVWAFLESTDVSYLFEETSQHPATFSTPLSMAEQAAKGPGGSSRPGLSPVCQSGGFRMASSQRSGRKAVGAGIVLGTGDLDKDQNCAKEGVDQYLRVARSIRRVARSFRQIGLAYEEYCDGTLPVADGQNFEGNNSMSSVALEGECDTHENKSDATAFCIESHRSSSSNKSKYESGSSPASLGREVFEKRVCECHLSGMSGVSCRCEAITTDKPCKAACWVEVVGFVQAIFRLQLRYKKVKSLAAAAHLKRKMKLAQANLSVVNDNSSKFSSLGTRVSNEASHGTTGTGGSMSSSSQKAFVSVHHESRQQSEQEKIAKSGMNRLVARALEPENSKLLSSSSYWIVFVALWIEQRMHVIARQCKDPSLIQRFCCCRLFTSADIQSSSIKNATARYVGLSMNSTSSARLKPSNSQPYYPHSYGINNSPPSFDSSAANRATPSTDINSHRSEHFFSQPTRIIQPSTYSNFGSPSFSSEDTSSPNLSQREEYEKDSGGACSKCNIDWQLAAEFDRVECVDLSREELNSSFNLGAQVDTLRRFLVLCFCAWSWIDDESITSGSVVAILQHVWWCANTQINLGLSQTAQRRLLDSSQSQNFPHLSSNSVSNAPSGIRTEPHQIRRHNPVPLMGKVHKIKEAMALTSGGRLLAQYFGQHSPAREALREKAGLSKGQVTTSNLSGIDFYAEHLALPTSWSTGDFENQVFCLMQSMGYKIASIPEVIMALSARWQSSLKEEQCCTKAEGFNFEALAGALLSV